MTAIPVLYSFARSGGTLVNQLLGTHPQCLVLSEVNPAASYKSVVDQATEWLGLVEEPEKSEFSDLPYHEQIIILHNCAAALGKRLVVRDWATVNYLPGCAGTAIVPSEQLEQECYLQRAGFQTMPVVIVRRSGAVFQSITQNFVHLQDLSLNDFAMAYMKYAQAVAEFPVFQIESLRSRPADILKDILERLDLNRDDCAMMLNSFHNFKKCTGNNTLKTLSLSAISREILPMETSTFQKAVLLNSHPVLLEADRILGYD